ncbi:TetR/AcrR family transcriptional regulator [Venenivibrio stagnispumantis]|uniref:Transcriptional regulator, TetR family n=1 Tax=Venenivibrio stagnispumantis TaxID=407998 RepID=A0AA45WJ58_9AQUI|nr:TetR/AcrR family transcriptional regulator [Venenivibrio stagnispumantis]MCW4572491.1 TetR/AcrR family transcriptional regulator [Venenivibrio stagnispumantis]SMP02325.1 transcriptional regulator, TetR family [Venenivibrio stagnispumantis]
MAVAEELSTKEKIIKAGAEIIVKEGLRKFTARNVANKIGLTDAALYKHFPSLDDIIIQIIERYIKKCSESVDRAVEIGGSTVDILKQVMREHISVLEETRGAVPILCFEFSRSGNKKFFDILHKFVESYKTKLSAIIRIGQKEGIIREDINPEDTAMLFVGLIQAKTFAYVMENREGKIIQDPEMLISELFYGILKR